MPSNSVPTTTLTTDGKRLADAIDATWPAGIPGESLWVEHLNAAAATLFAARDCEGVGLRGAFRHADTEDWTYLDGRLGHGGRCRFWRTVFTDARAALARPQPEAKGPVAAGVKEALEISGIFGEGGQGKLTIRDLAYTAFMRAKGKNDEDGGPTDWFTDTLPLVLKGIEKLRGYVDASTTPPAEAKTPDAGVESLRRKLVAFNVRDEVDQYEFCGDEGDYTPTERERVLLEDFGNGLVSAIGDALFPTGSAGEDDTGVREALDQFEEAVREEVREAHRFTSSDPGLVVSNRKQARSRLEQALNLAPQPPKAETPAGLGDALGEMTQEAALRNAFAQGAEWQRNQITLAPAARPGDEVERVSEVLRVRLERWGYSTGSCSRAQLAHDILDALAAAPAADGGRA